MTTDIETPTQRDEVLIRRVNEAFDQARQRLGFSSDKALARHYGVSEKTVSFWRNGRWVYTDRVLINVLIGSSENAQLVA